MFKKLLLARHAQAFDSEPGISDYDRELTGQGMKDSSRMGKFLSDHQLKPDLILSSAASRAKNTAIMMAEQLNYNTERIVLDEELYEASVRIFLKLINELDDQYEKVLMLGHNPTISHLAEYLTDSEVDNVRKAGIVIINFEIKSWAEVSKSVGHMEAYHHPDNI